MDQAGTLRHLVGQAQHRIEAVMADAGCPYLKPLCQALLEHNAKHESGSLIFDGGFLVAQPSERRDLLQFLQQRIGLEDLSRSLLPGQYLVQSVHAFSQGRLSEELASALLQKLHRLPATCDYLYATLEKSQWALARQLASAGDCFWLVQPMAKSVTQTFQAIRQLAQRDAHQQHRIIVVGGRDAAQADEVYASLQDVTHKVLSNPLQYCGHIPKLKQENDKKDIRQACERIARVMTRSAQLACA